MRSMSVGNDVFTMYYRGGAATSRKADLRVSSQLGPTLDGSSRCRITYKVSRTSARLAATSLATLLQEIASKNINTPYPPTTG